MANRRRLRGRWLDGNPIGRICLARFAAPRGDGRVMACDPRVPGAIAPRLHPPVLVFFGSLGHRFQIRSSPRIRPIYAPRGCFRELAVGWSSLPRGVLQTRGRPGSRRWRSIRFTGTVCVPSRVLRLPHGLRRRSADWNNNNVQLLNGIRLLSMMKFLFAVLYV